MSVLSIDFETRSTVDLKKTGVYRYAEDPTTDVWCMAWAFDDEEPQIWKPEHASMRPTPAGLPQCIVDHIEAGGEIRAWNAQFERIMWREIMVKRYGAPEIKLEQFVDSAAEAAAMSLPRDLGRASQVLGVEQIKDDKGHRLMLQMCKPRKIHPDGRIEWWDVEEKKQRLFDYCQQDVRTERALVKALRRLTAREREIYLLDQRINDRGVEIDLDLVNAAQLIVDQAVTRANSRLDDLTSGAVEAVTENQKLLNWLNEQDMEIDSIAKPVLAELFARDDLTETVEEVLRLRADVGRASVKKLKAMVYATCFDGAARGLLLYHAAGTGRWAGKIIQPQNFPRGEIADPESFIPLVRTGDYEALSLFGPPVITILSMLRAMLVARDGHDLLAGDYAAIEARVLNWLAGQDDIVKMFAGGIDVYKHNASKLYGIPIEQVLKYPHRQTGKFQELGCGFGMGWKKAVSAAKDQYGLDLTPERAKWVVEDYRNRHPIVKQFWDDADEACIEAVLNPGVVYTFGARGNLKATRRGGYLYIVLPSGRPLCYADPKVKDRKTPWGDWKPAVHFWGVDQKTRQWVEQSGYGGFWAENVTQAVARDLMAEAMLRLEERGYPTVLTVHDEIVTEVPEGFGTVEEFEQLMAALPAWAEGCPVAAEGWRGKRYRK